MWRFILPSSFCLIGGLVIYSCSPVRQADNKAARHAVKTIYPTQAFDSVSIRFGWYQRTYLQKDE
jgi:hypothetical protein